MVRPVKVRTPSEHVTTLSRMQLQVQQDESLKARRKKRIVELVSALITEFQKEVVMASEKGDVP